MAPWLLLALTASAYYNANPRAGVRSRVASHSRVAGVCLAEDDGVTIRVRTPDASAAPVSPAPAPSSDVQVTIRTAKGQALADAPQAAQEASVTVRTPASSAAQPTAPVPPPDTPNGLLIEASRTGAIRGIRAALKAGADPNAQDANGFSALHLAAATGLAPGVVVLAKAGADFNYRAQNLTPLTIAIGYNKPFTVETIVKCGADVTEADADGVTPRDFLANLIKVELEQQPEKKETLLTRNVNKRLESLRKMEASLALVPAGQPALSPEEARKNIDAMLAELAELLGW